MKRHSSIWQHIARTCRQGPVRWLHLLSGENFRKLFKAVREEPPDLILENFIRLLRTGKPQDPYPPNFIEEQPDLKFHIVYCRKESGILKVMIWVLARKGLRQALLLEGDVALSIAPFTFIKPELSEMYSAFSDFEQTGLVFEGAFDGVFSDIKLQLVDRAGGMTCFPIGTFCLRQRTAIPEKPALTAEAAQRIVVLLTDWGIPKPTVIPVNSMIYQNVQFENSKVNIILCGEMEQPQVGPGARVLPHHLLNAHLQQLDFDYLLHLPLEAEVDQDFLPTLSTFLAAHPTADAVYFDEALVEAKDQYHSALLKPAFSPEYLAADNYIGSACCLSASLLQQTGWFQQIDFSAGLYPLLLRALAFEPDIKRLPGTRVYLPDYDAPVYEERTAKETKVRNRWNTQKSTIGEETPLVSLIIPFKDQVSLLKTCLQSIYQYTQHPRFELLLVSNNSEDAATYAYLEQVEAIHAEVRTLRWDHPFNYAALNNWASQQARGAVLLFLNNDVEVLTSGWLQTMLNFLAAPGVGAVGAKLLYPDDTVQHAGVICGIGGIAAHAHKHLPDALGGYAGRANVTQNLMAVTAACLLMRRALFDTIGGFDAKNLPIAFNDVDLCLEIIQAGYRIVYTPEVKLYHYESVSRGAEDTRAKRRRARREIARFRRKWKDLIRGGDPYYHPGFTQRRADFEEESSTNR